MKHHPGVSQSQQQAISRPSSRPCKKGEKRFESQYISCIPPLAPCRASVYQHHIIRRQSYIKAVWVYLFTCSPALTVKLLSPRNQNNGGSSLSMAADFPIYLSSLFGESPDPLSGRKKQINIFFCVFCDVYQRLLSCGLSLGGYTKYGCCCLTVRDTGVLWLSYCVLYFKKRSRICYNKYWGLKTRSCFVKKKVIPLSQWFDAYLYL